MRRVLIIGNAGSGKTTLAKRLAQKVALPLYHLDQLYWKAGWLRSDEAVFADKVGMITATDFWIMDGNYKAGLTERLERADLIVFLDIGRFRCLWNVVCRTFAVRGRVRAEMPDGCPEGFSLWFFRYIWDYPSVYRPMLLDLLSGYEGKLVRLSAFTAYEEWEREIGSK